MEDSDQPSLMKFYGGVSDEDPRIGVLSFTLPEAPANHSPPPTRDQALAIIVATIAGERTAELKAAFEVVDDDKSGATYREVLNAVLSAGSCSKAFRDALHLNWTVRGFRHREAVSDDALLIAAFRCVFPPYVGEPMTLYRGEQAGKWEAGRVGLNWSSSRDVGRRFAAGLCTTYGGDGVLLCATAPPDAIIALPNDHSTNRLQEHEHIVDPALLVDVREIDRFPPDEVPKD
jgi:hypothetical protein